MGWEHADLIIQDTVEYRVYRPGGDVRRFLRLPTRPRFGLRHSGGLRFPYTPLTENPSTTRLSMNPVVASATEPELRVFTAGGDLQALHRWAYQKVEVDARTRKAEEDRRVTNNPDPNDQRMERTLLSQVPWPEHLPVTATVIADSMDRIWVRQYQTASDSSASLWWVFTQDQGMVGKIHLPNDWDVLDAADGRVLVRLRNEIGVQGVGVFSLSEPPRPD